MRSFYSEKYNNNNIIIILLQQDSASLHSCYHRQSVGVVTLPFLLLIDHFLIGPITVSHFVTHEDQNGNHSNPQAQMKQVQGDMEASEQQGDAHSGNAPGPGQEEQEGVIEGAEDKSRGGQDEPQQCGGQP